MQHVGAERSTRQSVMVTAWSALVVVGSSTVVLALQHAAVHVVVQRYAPHTAPHTAPHFAAPPSCALVFRTRMSSRITRADMRARIHTHACILQYTRWKAHCSTLS